MMTIREAFKLFVKELTGSEPTGETIADVIRDGAAKIKASNGTTGEDTTTNDTSGGEEESA